MENLIFKKIPIIMGKVGAISKDNTNNVQGYKFRGIDDMYNALNRHLAEEQVFFTSEVISNAREERESKNGGTLIYSILTMKFTAYAEDGSFVSSTTVGEAMDSGDKSMNKAMSTAYKYALMQIFCIPTEDEKDTETETHEVKTKTVDTPNGGTKPKAMSSKDESCPSCGFVNKDIKKGTTKEGRAYEKCACECGTTYFINR